MRVEVNETDDVYKLEVSQDKFNFLMCLCKSYSEISL